MNLRKQLYPAVVLTLVLTVILGIIYPVVVTVASQIFFSEKAHGSLIAKDGKVIGSNLMGQPFTAESYFYSRPSAAGIGYDGTSSGGTNLGPTSKKLMEEKIDPEVKKARQTNSGPIPVDLVTSSASGLDPHITPASAEFQVDRVAKARNMNPIAVRQLIDRYTEDRQFGFLGEPRVNVLLLNIALDDAFPLSKNK